MRRFSVFLSKRLVAFLFSAWHSSNKFATAIHTNIYTDTLKLAKTVNTSRQCRINVFYIMNVVSSSTPLEGSGQMMGLGMDSLVLGDTGYSMCAYETQLE